MNMSPHVDAVRADLTAAAELGDDDLKSAAARLGRALDSSVRMRMQELLGEAVHELNGQLESSRVELHLAGDSIALAFVGDDDAATPEPASDDTMTARITLRLPETLKTQAEEAAAREGVSTNTWLARAVAQAVGKRGSARERAAGSPATPRAERSPMTTHPTPTPPRLDLRIPAGSIEIELEERDTTTVELTAISGGDAAQAAIDATKQELHDSGGRLEIIVHAPERSGKLRIIGRQPELRLRITAPLGSSVRASTITADFHCSAGSQDVTCKTVSGDISVGDADGAVKFESTSGNLHAGSVGGRLQAGSMSGDITAGAVGADSRARTMSGSVSIAAAAGSVKASSMSGRHRGRRPGHRRRRPQLHVGRYRGGGGSRVCASIST